MSTSNSERMPSMSAPALAARGATPAGDERVGLGPERLDVACTDAGEMRSRPHLDALFAPHHDGISLAQPETPRVASRYEKRVAVGSGERIPPLPDHRVELLPAPGREPESALGDGGRRGGQRPLEMRAAVPSFETPALAKPRTPPPEL